MPYNELADLPEPVRDALPQHAQEIYLAAYNSAEEGTCADAEDKEACAAAVAWTAVKESYEQDDDGAWHEKAAAPEATKTPEQLLTVKLFDADNRLLEGYASLWGVEDYQGEVMERSAIEPYLSEYLKNGPLHWQHGRDDEVGMEPIGKVLEARCDDVGLWIRAQVYKGTRAAEKAWALIKQGVRGLSVGAPSNGRRVVNGIIKVWRLIEISVTHMPAVAGATFSLAKAMELAKASGGEVLDPQMSRLWAQLEDLELKAVQADGAQKARWQKALAAYRQALNGDDQAAENADKIYHIILQEMDEMEKNEMQELIAKTVAESMAAAKAAEVEAAEKAATEEKKVEELATKKAEEMLAAKAAANPALKRAMYPTEEEQPRGESGILRGPYDDLEPADLALTYMVCKQWFPTTQRRPSRELFRALHGKLSQHIESGGWATKSFTPKYDRESLQRMAQPLQVSPKLDYALYKQIKSASADELYGKADELMGTDVTNAGDEWIPQAFSRELIPMIRNEAKVQGLFRMMEVEGESLTIPTQYGTFVWYKTPQTDDAAETVRSDAFYTGRTTKAFTSKIVLTPGKLSALAIYSGELNEQSLISMAPFLRENLVLSGREVIDEILISGDETTTNANISDYGNSSIATTWRLLLLDGLRHKAIVDTAANSRDGGALTAEDFLATKKLMGTNGKNALDPSKLVWIFDPAAYFTAQALGEVITSDKAGGRSFATFVSGMLDRIYGSPVIASDQYGATDTSGYIHNTTGGNVKGSFMCVRPDQGVIGWGRRMVIESSRIAHADAYEIVAHMMFDWNHATDEAVALTYNVTVV